MESWSRVARMLGVVAIVLLISGFAWGYSMPVSSGGYDCGTAFRESSDLLSDEFADVLSGGSGESGCDEARSTAKTLPIVLLVLGVAAAGAAVAAGRVEPTVAS